MFGLSSTFFNPFPITYMNSEERRQLRRQLEREGKEIPRYLLAKTTNLEVKPKPNKKPTTKSKDKPSSQETITPQSQLPQNMVPRKIRSRIHRTRKRVLGGLVVVATLLGGYAAAKPRLTIYTAGPSDDRNPLPASFVISNDGYFPALNVSPLLMIGKIERECISFKSAMGRPAFVTSHQEWEKSRTLEPGDKIVVPLSDSIIFRPETRHFLQIGLHVTYSPPCSDSVRQGLRRLQFVCLQGFPLPVQFGGIFANLFGGLTLLVSDTIISVI